jgi:hypothetical protein
MGTKKKKKTVTRGREEESDPDEGEATRTQGDSDASGLHPSLVMRITTIVERTYCNTPCLADGPDKDFPRGQTSAEDL